MALRQIVTYPFPILKDTAKPVTDFGPEFEKLVADMAETMYDAPGVGLAAPQINIPLQLCVIDISPKDAPRELIVLANPKIIKGEGEEVDEEGCLSVREYCSNVPRYAKIWVEAQDINGQPLSFEAEGYYARVIQHEADHLDGFVILDRADRKARAEALKRLRNSLYSL